MEKKAGNQGLAAIVLPDNSGKIAEDALNHLVVTKPLTNQTATWWAGFCWDKAGEITSAEAWKKHVVEYAQGLTAPIKVTVATGK
jgi:hypothetical protein